MNGTGEPGSDGGEREAERLGPRLYVASLSDYNAGILHGSFVQADADVDRMESEIAAMLMASPTTRRTGEPAEEWAIHDHDGWGGIELGGYESLETLARLADGLIEHGSAYGAWVGLVGVEEALSEDFEDRYIGQFASLTDYGESTLDDLGLTEWESPELPEGLRPYVHIDVAGWVRDMRLSGVIVTAGAMEGDIYVFYA